MNQPITIRDTGVKATEILDMIARGFSYYQILLSNPKLTLADIMVTAKLAQELMENFVTQENTIAVKGELRIIASGGRIQNLTKLREATPRAFEKWTRREEEELVQLYHSQKSFAEIAKALRRGRGAIKTRLERLGVLHSERAAEN